MDKLKLALGIISGRVNADSLGNTEYYALGYEPYSFSALGCPDRREIKFKAENIILDAIKEKYEK